jgi:hypothetical protein
MVDDEVWGTVSFSSRTIRTKPFDASVMRILAAGAEEISAAHQIANPANPRAEAKRNRLPTGD